MRFHILLIVSALLMFPAVQVFAQKDPNPVYLDKKKSEWTEMLKTNENVRHRKTAVNALASIANENPHTAKEIYAALGNALRSDPHLTVRRQVAVVFGQNALKVQEKTTDIDTRAVVTDMIDSLRSEKESEVRKEIAISLGLYAKEAKAAVSPLIGVLKDTDVGVRAAAAETLGRIGPDAKAAAPELLPLLKDTEEGVRVGAVFALGRINPEDIGKIASALVPLLKSEKNAEARKAVVTSLCMLNERGVGVVQSIANMLTDESVEVRLATSQGMAKLGPALKLVESEMTKCLKEDKDAAVRTNVVRTLCEGFGSESKLLLPLLLDRLVEEKVVDVRITIVEEMSKVVISSEMKKEETEKVLAALREAQRDPLQPLRESATEAIKRIQRATTKPKDKDK